MPPAPSSNGDYVLTNVNFLAAAGSSTVDYALRNVLWALLAHPELAAPVAAGDADAVDPIVTETFRYAPPVPHEGRIVTTDVEWHGRIVRGGIDRPGRARVGHERRDRVRRATALRPGPC